MSVEKAKHYFADRSGPRKMNCCESVAYAFLDHIPVPTAELDSYRNYGGGRAPGGYCGAIYATKRLLEISGAHEKVNEAEEAFAKAAGSLQCREIKALKKIPCLECVGKAAEEVVKHRKH